MGVGTAWSESFVLSRIIHSSKLKVDRPLPLKRNSYLTYLDRCISFRGCGLSTSNGEEPSSEPLGFDHLLATMWHVLADVGQLRLAQGLPDEVKRVLEQATPIPSLT